MREKPAHAAVTLIWWHFTLIVHWVNDSTTGRERKARSLLNPSYLEFMLFSVHNNSSDLLVHEYQDGAEEGGYDSSQHCPPGIWSNWANNPTTVISCRLQQDAQVKQRR